jgi:hypothetical protein
MICRNHVGLYRKPHVLAHVAIMTRLIDIRVVLFNARKVPDEILVHLIVIQRFIIHDRLGEIIIISEYKLFVKVLCQTTNTIGCGIFSRPVPSLDPEGALLFL